MTAVLMFCFGQQLQFFPEGSVPVVILNRLIIIETGVKSMQQVNAYVCQLGEEKQKQSWEAIIDQC